MREYSNHLIHETSPYLLQHAHNPVEWYPWGEAALERAKQENKPILVSIGYAACHWCHVMERESFEDEATARIMNEHFINIKIDREERPDLDHIYMDAVQAMSGSGGWPLNVFLLPDKKPFYGGTYFPPVKAYNRPSWQEVLLAINDAFHNRRTDIEQQAATLVEHLAQSNQFGMQAQPKLDLKLPLEELFTKSQLDTIAQNILAQSDNTWGGFGKAPKFPGTFNIQYLLKYYHVYGDEAALKQALLSLDKMLQGGIYDQLGGGFARYSTDEQWLAPHFEKMLYDNALLVDVLCDAYQMTGNQVYADTVAHTLQFVQREMTSLEGLFYAALDADSEGVEGKFYTWQKAEIEAVLGDAAGIFCEYYGVTEGGNWEETNILWVQEPLEAFAKSRALDPETTANSLAESRAKMLKAREERVRPGLDDKAILSWNALMIHAYCKAYASLGIDAYRQAAITAADAIWAYFKQGGEEGMLLYHTFKNGQAKYPAFLDDYAYFVRSLIALQEVTGSLEYLNKATQLTEHINRLFVDEQGIYYYYTAERQEDVIVRKKEIYDGATPSGNAIMAQNLLYLSIVFDNKQYRDQAIGMISRLSQTITRYPTSFGIWANLMLQLLDGTREIAVVGKDYKLRMQEAHQYFIPFKVLIGADSDQKSIPLLEGREVPGDTLVYLCKDYHCIKPVHYIKEIINLI